MHRLWISFVVFGSPILTVVLCHFCEQNVALLSLDLVCCAACWVTIPVFDVEQQHVQRAPGVAVARAVAVAAIVVVVIVFLHYVILGG